MHAEERFLGSHVRALTLELGRRHAYTEQHTRRVALPAVQVGERLELSRRHLRNLAIGSLLHGIGKLAVPTRSSRSPARSTTRSTRSSSHAEWGTRLLDQIGGLPKPVRRLVRGHHERLDSGGYPNRPTADEIDLDTRILSVCDVYDALISSRVYRPPWTHQEAMALLREEVGSAFDARCVNALAEVLDIEAGQARGSRACAAAAAPTTPAGTGSRCSPPGSRSPSCSCSRRSRASRTATAPPRCTTSSSPGS